MTYLDGIGNAPDFGFLRGEWPFPEGDVLFGIDNVHGGSLV